MQAILVDAENRLLDAGLLNGKRVDELLCAAGHIYRARKMINSVIENLERGVEHDKAV